MITMFSCTIEMSHTTCRASPGASEDSVCLQCRRPGFDPWVGKILWRRKWQPTPVFLPGESHGQRSLAGYSPRGRTESDTAERLHSLTHSHTICMATARCRSGGIMPGDLPEELIKDAPYLSFLPLQHIFFFANLAMVRKSFSQSHWPLRRFLPVLFASIDHILRWSFSWYCSHFIFLLLPTPPFLGCCFSDSIAVFGGVFSCLLDIAVPHGSLPVLASGVILLTSLAPIISMLDDFVAHS